MALPGERSLPPMPPRWARALLFATGLASLALVAALAGTGASGQVADQAPPHAAFEPAGQLGARALMAGGAGDRLYLAQGTRVSSWRLRGDSLELELDGEVGTSAPAELVAPPGEGVLALYPEDDVEPSLRWLRERDGLLRPGSSLTVSSRARALAADGSHAFFAEDQIVHRVALGPDGALTRDGSSAALDDSGYAASSLHGDRLFLAQPSFGARLFDAKAEPAPLRRGRWLLPQGERAYPSQTTITDLAAHGDRLVVVGGGRWSPPDPTPVTSATPLPPWQSSPTPTPSPTNAPYLRVLDVSDPDDPREAGRLFGGAYVADGVALDESGTHALVAMQGGVRWIDLATPDRPRELASRSGQDDARPVILGRRAVLFESHRLQLLDLDGAELPVLWRGVLEPMWSVRAIVPAGAVSLIADLRRIRAVDLDEQGRISARSDVVYPQLRGLTADAAGRAAAWDGRHLQLLSFADPARPYDLTPLRDFDHTPGIGGFRTQRMALTDDELLVATGEGLLVLDARSPRLPELARVPMIADRMIVHRELAIVSAHGDVLEILDLGDPRAPRRLSRLEGAPSGELVARDDTLFVLGRDRIDVLDLRDPALPVWQGSLALDGQGQLRAGFTAGNQLYVVGASVLQLDLAEPGLPRLVATASYPKVHRAERDRPVLGRHEGFLLSGGQDGSGLSSLRPLTPLPPLPSATVPPGPTPLATATTPRAGPTLFLPLALR